MWNMTKLRAKPWSTFIITSFLDLIIPTPLTALFMWFLAGSTLTSTFRLRMPTGSTETWTTRNFPCGAANPPQQAHTTLLPASACKQTALGPWCRFQLRPAWCPAQWPWGLDLQQPKHRAAQALGAQSQSGAEQSPQQPSCGGGPVCTPAMARQPCCTTGLRHPRLLPHAGLPFLAGRIQDTRLLGDALHPAPAWQRPGCCGGSGTCQC